MATPRTRKSSPNAIYFCTMSVLEWIDIFTRPVYFDLLVDSLCFCQKNKGLNLFGFVFMTNHIHLIFSTIEGHSAEVFLRDFKKWTTRAVVEEVEREPRRYIKNLLSTTIFKKRANAIQVWQPGNFSEIVGSAKFFLQKLNYVHMNPVRKGYVTRPEDWKYSSARNWIKNDHSLIRVITTELF